MDLSTDQNSSFIKARPLCLSLGGSRALWNVHVSAINQPLVLRYKNKALFDMCVRVSVLPTLCWNFSCKSKKMDI